MRAINISYLNRMDVERVALTDDDILNAVEAAVTLLFIMMALKTSI